MGLIANLRGPQGPPGASVFTGDPRVLYVRGDAGSDANAGSSWGAAYKTIQAAINALPTTTPARGGVLHIAPSVHPYAPFTVPEGVKFVFEGGRGVAGNANFGCVVAATADNQTIIDVNGGGSIMQGGPIIEGGVQLDGAGHANVKGLRLYNTNRCTTNNLVIRQCAVGVELDGTLDCAWHNFYSFSGRENAVNFNCLWGYGIRIFGGEINCSSSQTAVKLGDTTRASTSQFSHVVIDGLKVDGGKALDSQSAWMVSANMDIENSVIGASIAHNSSFPFSGTEHTLSLRVGDASHIDTAVSLGAGTSKNRIEGWFNNLLVKINADPTATYSLTMNGQSITSEFGSQVTYVEGVGRINGSDGDFPVAPTNGTVEAVKNTTTGLTYLSVKTSNGWRAVQIA